MGYVPGRCKPPGSFVIYVALPYGSPAYKPVSVYPILFYLLFYDLLYLFVGETSGEQTPAVEDPKIKGLYYLRHPSPFSRSPLPLATDIPGHTRCHALLTSTAGTRQPQRGQPHCNCIP